MMRFDRFTERAQEAAQRAAEIIQRYGHNQIDTEHILLALIEQPQGVIPQILEYSEDGCQYAYRTPGLCLTHQPESKYLRRWRRADLHYTPR
jgi:ATP-dependent Clp protease ATP-binding subunit ClpA